MDSTQLTFVNARLQTVKESQQRARTALLIVLFAVAIVVITLWNAYIGWNLGLARSDRIGVVKGSDGQDVNGSDGRNESRHALIRNWVDSQFISIPLLGIKVSSDDAEVLGGLLLLVLNWYYYLCLRRENEDVRVFLDESTSLGLDLRKHISWSVNAGNVFNIEADARIAQLLLPIFVYAPVAAVLLTVGADLWCVLGPYDSPFRGPGPGLWSALKTGERVQLVFTDVFAVGCAVIMAIVCFRIQECHRSTGERVAAFAQRIGIEGAE